MISLALSSVNEIESPFRGFYHDQRFTVKARQERVYLCWIIGNQFPSAILLIDSRHELVLECSRGEICEYLLIQNVMNLEEENRVQFQQHRVDVEFRFEDLKSNICPKAEGLEDDGAEKG